MTKNNLKKLHLALFIYGDGYFDLCTSIVLPNLVSLLGELPDEIRAITELRVLTNPTGRDLLEAAPALKTIKTLIPVKIADTMVDGGYDLYGGYGPMILGQARLVYEASLEGAGIIFCPPDLVWSKGSFATIARLAQEGYRAVIGPSARGIAEELSPILQSRIEQGGGKSLEISSIDLTKLMFDHWQKINDDFFWNDPTSIFWKSYAYWRVGHRQLLMKCWQGPALFLWPYREVKDYDGWIDHRLIKACVHSQHEVYVVPDAREIHTLDLTPRDRVTGLARQSTKRWPLFKQLLIRKRHCRFNIRYGEPSIRIYEEPASEAAWREADRQFNIDTRPAMYAAIVLRPPLALIDGFWRHSSLAVVVPKWRAKLLALRSAVKAKLLVSVGGYGPRTIVSHIRARLQIRTRLHHIGAAAMASARATNLRPRSRVNTIRQKLHDYLQRRR
jgi:hypothetical protein